MDGICSERDALGFFYFYPIALSGGCRLDTHGSSAIRCGDEAEAEGRSEYNRKLIIISKSVVERTRPPARSPVEQSKPPLSKTILVNGGLDMPFATSAQGYSTTEYGSIRRIQIHVRNFWVRYK